MSTSESESSTKWTLAGSTTDIRYDVKYEKLPNFCLCCGIVGHTSAKLCSIPEELRKASYSTDIKAPAPWKNQQASGGPVRRHLDFGGRPVSPEHVEMIKLPDHRVVTAEATAVQKLSVAAAPVLATMADVDAAIQAPAAGLEESAVLHPHREDDLLVGVSQEWRLLLAGSGSSGAQVEVTATSTWSPRVLVLSAGGWENPSWARRPLFWAAGVIPSSTCHPAGA